MNPNGKEIQLVQSDWRGKAVDRLGQQSYKGGQTIDVGILEAIPRCYTLLIYHPLGVCLFVLGFFILIAEYYASPGPLEYMADAFIKVSEDASLNNGTRGFSAVVATVFHLSTDYKTIIAKLCLVWCSYVVKPSGRNMLYAGVLSLIVLIMSLTFIKLIVISQLFFLFVCIRSPMWKTVIFLFFLFYTFTNYFNFDIALKKVQSTHRSLSKPIP